MTGEERDWLRTQVLGHLQSLQSAGVEWLPRGAARELVSRPPVVQPTDSPTAAVEMGPRLDERGRALHVLADEVKGCTRCAELCSTRTQTVFADGAIGSELCFVGEAPGADEDARGLPFVGRAGQLFDKIIAACGLARAEVYICNVLKCRPPNNRAPLPSEVANCRGYLEKQIELVRPKFICALGGCAASTLLQTTESLGRLRGRFHDFRGIPVLVTYHPSYLLPHRSPEKKREVWQDMKLLMARMGRTIPTKDDGRTTAEG